MEYDVVVAGGGPVGMMLACELRLGGTSVLVLEREASPDRGVKAGPLGARSINAPTADAFHRRGILKAVKEAAVFWFDPEDVPRTPGAGAPGRDARSSFAGHFAGIMVRADLIDFTDADLARHTLGGGVVNQLAVETILRRRAAELGVAMEFGVELAGFEADEEGVSIEAGGRAIRAGWLVGCDGGRSTVRKRAGFEFPGVDPEWTGRQALVETPDAERLGVRGWVHTDAGSYAFGKVPFARGDVPTRIHTNEPGKPSVDRDAPVTAEEMEASLFRVAGVDARITRVLAGVRYTDNTRQASTYRLGRILLAGDAAHVHWPAGGQGLNLGIGDAMNLGWKLAATVKGWAPDGLLDTYTSERHPVGAWGQDWSNAQTALIRLDPRTRALRAVVSDLLDTGPGATYVLKQISGVAQRLDLRGDHPLIGLRAPELAFQDGSTLAGRGLDGRALVVDLAGDAGLRELAGRWGRRVRVVDARPAGRASCSAMLVRPDGWVAWAQDGAVDLAAAEATMRAWLGRPD
jgi:2-polyprenyl-6-methoxyphenol hydroxylase-like FAD-dependent oxidoreductase